MSTMCATHSQTVRTLWKVWIGYRYTSEPVVSEPTIVCHFISHMHMLERKLLVPHDADETFESVCFSNGNMYA